MKVNYRRAILLFFLIISAMFLVIATTSGCINDGGDEPIYKNTATCTEGYKIEFANEKFEKAFVVGEKDGDLDRNIEVKVDQLTRANGFGAAMPEFKSLYDTAVAANADKGSKVKENDGITGLWGSYGDGLSRFILGLNINGQVGAIDGSGPPVAGTNGQVGKPAEDAVGFINASYTMDLTSGHVGAGGAFVDYDVTKVKGGAFHDQILGGGPGINPWFYATMGRLENLPGVIDARNTPLVLRNTVFTTDVDWKLSDANKGQALAGDTYDHKKGWQKLFSIKPCDDTVKNGLIAAQMTKKSVNIANTLVDAEKLHIKPLLAGTPENDVLVQMSNNGAGDKNIFIDSFIGDTMSGIGSLGFATINYNVDAATGMESTNFHTTTQLALMCRTSIKGISSDQAALFAVPAGAADVKADLLTGGAEKLDCYLGISNLYPDWYEEIVQMNVANAGHNKANTLDKLFSENEADRLSWTRYDTTTKKVGLVIANTGDVKLDSIESKALFYTGAIGVAGEGDFDEQQTKWDAFIKQDGVKTTYGTLTFKFVRPDIK